MAGGVRQRSFLTPTRDAPEHKARIARETDVRAETKSFHHLGTEAFDQRIGMLDQPQRQRDGLRALQVQADDMPAALQHLELRRQRQAEIAIGNAVDAQHGRTHFGEHHRRHGTRPNAGEFDYLDACERTHHAALP